MDIEYWKSGTVLIEKCLMKSELYSDKDLLHGDDSFLIF